MANETVIEDLVPPAPVDGGATASELPSTPPEEIVENAEPAPADPIAEPEPPAKEHNLRFSELTKQAKKLAQQAEESDRRLKIALDTLERVAPKVPVVAPATEEIETEPVAPEFETPEQYQRDMAQYARDLATYTARNELKAQRAREETERAQQSQLQEQARIRTEFAKRREAAMLEMPDYAEVAESENVQISMPMAHAISISEYGPKIAYFLGKNPAEAARIAALHPASQILELGMLTAKLLTPKPPTRTNAPAPIRPISGGASPAAKTLDEMSMEEYAASRAGKR